MTAADALKENNSADKSIKILIAYSSSCGATKGIAEFIGETIKSSHITTEVLHVSKIQNIDNYSAVFVGSPIQYDIWRKENTRFINRFQDVLQNIPVAYFFSCLTLSGNKENNRKQAQGYADKITNVNLKVIPVSVGQFAGVLDYKKLPLLFNILFRIAFVFVGLKEGDYRDWNAIRDWTSSTLLKMNL